MKNIVSSVSAMQCSLNKILDFQFYFKFDFSMIIYQSQTKQNKNQKDKIIHERCKF